MNLHEFEQAWKFGKTDVIRGLDDAQVGLLLTALLVKQESQGGDVNFDYLMKTGIMFAQAKKECADTVALRWLQENPSGKRLDLVAAFLNGFWMRAYRTQPVASDRIEMLLRLRGDGEVPADAEYSFVQAISQVLQPDTAPDVKSGIKKVFERVARRKFGTLIDQHIQSVVERALQRAV